MTWGVSNISYPGPPTSGTYKVGDAVIDSTGAVWECTIAGTPGTFVEGSGGGGGGGSPAGLWTPSDFGYAGWTWEAPGLISTQAPTAGALNTALIKAGSTKTISSIQMVVTTPVAAGLTANENGAAIYSAAGALLGKTTDQSTAWEVTNAEVTMNLTAGVSVIAGTVYIVAFWANGTTLPSFLTDGGTIKIGTPPDSIPARFGLAGSAVTTAPASITVASMTQGPDAWWVAIK